MVYVLNKNIKKETAPKAGAISAIGVIWAVVLVLRGISMRLGFGLITAITVCSLFFQFLRKHG